MAKGARVLPLVVHQNKVDTPSSFGQSRDHFYRCNPPPRSSPFVAGCSSALQVRRQKSPRAASRPFSVLTTALRISFHAQRPLSFKLRTACRRRSSTSRAKGIKCWRRRRRALPRRMRPSMAAPHKVTIRSFARSRALAAGTKDAAELHPRLALHSLERLFDRSSQEPPDHRVSRSGAVDSLCVTSVSDAPPSVLRGSGSALPGTE